MPRRRVAVALLPPPDLAAAVQSLRRALGDPRLDELPPHLTLIPPINLAAPAFAEGRELLRSVAEVASSFELLVGPAGTFAPATPTLHLELGGDLAELHALRAELRTGVFGRPDVWPFHPHVTLREELGEPARSGAVAALSASSGDWTVDRVHLLEQRDHDGVRRWVPIVEEPFGPPVVVGRGGIALELRTTGTVPLSAPGPNGAAPRPATPGRRELVVAASDAGRGVLVPPVGVAVGAIVGPDRPSASDTPGDVALLRSVAVDPSRRRTGIGRQVLRRWCHEAAALGAHLVVAEVDAPVAELLRSEGFVAVGTTHVRQLGSG